MSSKHLKLDTNTFRQKWYEGVFGLRFTYKILKDREFLENWEEFRVEMFTTVFSNRWTYLA